MILDHIEWVLFGWVLANQAGVPVPVVPALPTAGALAGSGRLSAAAVLALAVGAALCADLGWYAVGRWRGAGALGVLGHLSPKTQTLVRRARNGFLAHAGVFQLTGRFLPELNPIAAALAGATGLGLARFAAYGVGSALVWAVTWAGLGYLLGDTVTARNRWTALLSSYRAEYPELATEIDQMQRRDLPPGWDRDLPVFPAEAKGIAGRDASGRVLNVLARNIPWLLGGSADLGSSNKTTLTYEGAGSFQAGNPGGKNLHFGVREHAMAAIVNGPSLSKVRAFGGTFFIFSDYARPAIRLSALIELPTIFVFTHDAMGDGEDGPTHQPVEQLASLRAIPGLVTLRPGDANEVVEAYRYVMQLRHQPAALVLSRQPLPTVDRCRYAPATGVARGAYVLADPPGGNPEVIFIASSSELSLAVDAHETLLVEGIRSRVVSMPFWDIFDHQPEEYRDEVLPPNVKARVAVEQASTLGWERYVGSSGHVIGMTTFGASAPPEGTSEEVRIRARPGRGHREGATGQTVSTRVPAASSTPGPTVLRVWVRGFRLVSSNPGSQVSEERKGAS
jgi:membrane protein DedA with SNARE-associated domain/transketolase C-terminal domain/subunit